MIAPGLRSRGEGVQARSDVASNHARHSRRPRPGVLLPWLRRYGPGDLAGWLLSLACGGLALVLWDSPGRMAGAAVLGENLGFYGVVMLRERRGLRRRHPWGPSLRALLEEFALAEVLDTCAIRPLALLGATTLLGSPFLGITVGGLAADFLFYVNAGLARRRAPGQGRAS